jgi:hypothetical protein
MWNGPYAGQFELPAMPRKRAGSEIVADEDEDDDMEVDEDENDFVEGGEEEVADSDSDSDNGVNISRPTAGRPQIHGQQIRPWARSKSSGSAKTASKPKARNTGDTRVLEVRFSKHDGTLGLGSSGWPRCRS